MIGSEVFIVLGRAGEGGFQWLISHYITTTSHGGPS